MARRGLNLERNRNTLDIVCESENPFSTAFSTGDRKAANYFGREIVWWPENSGVRTRQIRGASRFGGIRDRIGLCRRHNEILHLASERLRQFRVEMQVIFYDFRTKNATTSID